MNAEPTEAEVAAISKTEAETDAILSGLNRTAQLHVVRLARQEAEAQWWQANTREKLLMAAKAERAEQELLSGERYHNIYAFATAVSMSSVVEAIAALRVFDQRDPVCPIRVEFTSGGGEVDAGFRLYAYLQGLSIRGGGTHELTTFSTLAASMAGILFQVGDKRVMAKEGWLLIHDIKAAKSGSLGEIEDAVDYYKRITERVKHIYVERSGGKLTMDVVNDRMSRHDWWIDSAEALALGLADAIA